MVQRHRQDRVCVAEIVAPHGIQGRVKIRNFCSDASALATYSLCGEDGKEIKIFVASIPNNSTVIGEIDGCNTRDNAERLRGTKLYVFRKDLPPPVPGEHYQHDLLGAEVLEESGKIFGRVHAFHNFGAGDIVEISLASNGKMELFLFNQSIFPVVDSQAHRLVIHPPEIVMA